MSASVFFCGETVADLFQPKGDQGALNLALGGSHYNAALGASRAVERDQLDVKVGFVGPVSTDMLGNRFQAAMAARAIDLRGMQRVELNTTLALVFQRPGEENAFTFYSAGTTLDADTIKDLPTDLGAESDCRGFWFGSISTVIEPARFAWLDYAKKLRDSSLVVYDLNTRPSIAKSPEHHREIISEWTKVAHVIKASDADVAWTYPGMSMQDIAQLWLDSGASMAVFTKGMHGSEAYTKTTRAEAETLDLIAENTVGAGDNFNAGLAIAMTRSGLVTTDTISSVDQHTLEATIRYANETAAYHLINIGAKPRKSLKTGVL